MPIFDDYSDPGQTRIGYIPPQPKPADPSVWDTVKAGAALELDMVNLWQSMSAPKFKPQDGFEIGPTLRNYDAENSTSYFEDYRDRLIGVSSDDEFNYQIEKIKKEEEYRRTLAASGTLGILAQIGAGIVSPTVFLPFVGQSRGLAAVAKAVGYSFFGAGIQEGILYQNQITRTPEEVMFSLAASTALGGILGSAHVMLRPHEKQLFASHLEEAAMEIRGEKPPVKIGDEIVPGAKPVEGEPPHLAPRVEQEPVPVVLKGAEDIRAERGLPTAALTRAQEVELREAVFQVAGEDVRLHFQDIIRLTGQSADTAAREWGTAAQYASGKWSPEGDVITLSRAHADLGTAYHEAFHRLQDMLLTAPEREVLGKSRKEMEALVAEKHPAERIAKMSDRELQAEAFSEWMRKGAQAPAPALIDRTWQLLKGMLQRAGNLVKGWGFQNAEDIFKKAAAGDIAKRTPVPVDGAEEAAQMAWHGSPHWFDKFMTKFMGTGEGAQTFGWGLYFTQKKGIAESYKSKLSNEKAVKPVAIYKADNEVIDDIYAAASKTADMLKDPLTRALGALNLPNDLAVRIAGSHFTAKMAFYDFLSGKVSRDEAIKAGVKILTGTLDFNSNWMKLDAATKGEIPKAIARVMDDSLNEFDVKTAEFGGVMHRGGKAVSWQDVLDDTSPIGNAIEAKLTKAGVSSSDFFQFALGLRRIKRELHRATDYNTNKLLGDEADFIKKIDRLLLINTRNERLMDEIYPEAKQIFDYFKEAEWKNMPGRLYKVEVPDDEDLLNWSLPVAEQPDKVKAALEQLGFTPDMDKLGRDVIKELEQKTTNPKEASLMLLSAGIPGHKFPANSMGGIDPNKAQNFVIYTDDAVEIKEYFQQNFRATETPEFQRWFRNSKVVDDEGNPLVVFHGTSKDVDFDRFKVNKNGIWFTPDSYEASQYAIQNDSMGYKRDGWTYTPTNTASRVIPTYVSLQNPMVLREWPDEILTATNYKRAQGLVFTRYKNEGYDGVLMVDGANKPLIVVAFDSVQVKSVYNKGAWAPTDPRISYQIVDQPPDRVGGLARGAQTWAKVTDATKVLTNPVTQSINQTTFGTVRDIARKMGDAGLKMEGNTKKHYDENGNLLYTTHAPSTEQGTIENRIPEYWGMFDQSTRKINDIYADYIFNGKPPKLFPGTRASIASRSRGKLAFWEFSRAVARTIFNGFETAPNEHVLEAARAVHDGFYKPIFDRAVEVGLLDADMKLVGDKAYLNRVYNITAINANPQKFIKILQDHFETKHRESMEADIKKYLAEKASEEQFLEDALLTADDYNALSARLTEAEKNIEETLPEPVREIEEQLQGLRTAAKAAKKLGDDAEYDRLWGEAKQMEKDNYHLLKDSRDAKAAVRRRLKNLSRGVVAATKEQEKQLTKLEKTFSKNMDGLRRVARMAQQILPKLGRLSDKELDAQVSKLRNMFAGVANDYDRLVERATVVAADPEMGPSLYLDQLMMKKADRLTELTAKLQVAEGADRVTLRADIEEGLNLVMEKVNEINTTRSIRAAKAVAKADELDPAAKAKALEDQRGQIKFNEMDFVRQLEERGAEGVDLSTGTVNVRELALRDAEEFKNTVTGTMLHLPVVEVMALERGPELLRMLDIPSTQIEEFLEFDINKLMRMYTRTFAPDIEITRTFGTVNFADIWKPVEEELDKLSRQLHQVHGHNPEYEGKKQTALRAEYDQYKLNVRAMYERLRGLRGLPSNPDDIAWRGAKLVADFNVLRQMGMVLSASLPDVGRPIIRYGLTRTMKDGIIPMITNFQQFKLSALEAVYSGAAVDTSAHLRSTGFHDTMDDLMRGTKFERAVSYLSTHMGILALFDIWTDKMKLITGAISNGKIMESLATVNGVEGYMPMAKAMDFLAQNSISGSMAEAMWREITENGGGQRINGVWWPNTKSWINPEAVRTYRQMLAREVNNTIVTPGIDKPLYADVNMVGRLLYQFKSFGLASNSRIVMSGLQQQDAAVLNGVLVSLAMGAVSYAAWATLTGGKAYEDMRNASAEKWIDEMIQRSGLFGALGEVQRVGQTVPALSPYMSLSNTKSTRRPGDNLVESLLGPSFGLLQEAGNVIGGLHEPTQATAHALRKMMPFQQTMILREIWDAFEAGLAHVLPERRTP